MSNISNFISHFSSKKFTQTSTLSAILIAILSVFPTNQYLQLLVPFLLALVNYNYVQIQGGIDSISAKNALNQIVKTALPIVEVVTTNQPEVHQVVEEAKPVIEEITQPVSDPAPIVVPVNSELSASITAILESAKSIIANLENTKNVDTK